MQGFTMPLSPKGTVQASAIPEKHFGGRIMGVLFRADRKAMQDLVPYPLELPEDPIGIVRINELLNDQGNGDDWVLANPEQSQYFEAVVAIPLEHNGVLGNYDPYLWVDNFACAVGGREIYGLPKKMAKVSLSRSYPRSPIGIGSTVHGTTEADSTRLVTASVKLERELQPGDLPVLEGFYTLRHLPPAVKEHKPIHQVLKFVLQNYTVHEAYWGSEATLEFGDSPFEELLPLQPTEILGGYYSVVDWDLPWPELVYEEK